MSGPRGFGLSGAQVIASVLATLTGALAASYLGVGGTLLGAAVGSVASTLGTAIYKHYLERSQERLRTAGQVLYHSGARPRNRDTVSGTGTGTASGGRHTASSGTASQQGAAREQAARETAVWDSRQYGAPRDPHETQMIPGLATTQWDGTPNGGPPTGGAANGGGPGDTASQHAHENLTEEGPTAGRGSVWAAVTSFFGELTRRQWLTYGAIAGSFFLIVVMGITIFELAVGKPVLGNAFSGRSTQHQGTTHPTGTPSATPSATPTGSTSATPTPSVGSSSGTPTPGASGASSSPSTVPSPTPSSSSGSSTTVTPTP
ncbi:MAG: hypothetical protein ACLP5E_21540 [Streptosporangiaceae bacterium]